MGLLSSSALFVLFLKFVNSFILVLILKSYLITYFLRNHSVKETSRKSEVKANILSFFINLYKMLKTISE